MIDFSIEPEFQAKLDWMNAFVREECETMDLLWPEMGANFETHRADARWLGQPAARVRGGVSVAPTTQDKPSLPRAYRVGLPALSKAVQPPPVDTL